LPDRTEIGDFDGSGLHVAMRIVQWLDRPAADFIYAAQW
jgi:hypothetical protein